MSQQIVFKLPSKNLRYYIPLCPRPKIIVTPEMIQQVESTPIDYPIVKKYQSKLMDALSEQLYEKIYEHSDHFLPGAAVRALIVSIPLMLLCNNVDAVMFLSCGPVLYMSVILSIHRANNLHYKFLQFTDNNFNFTKRF